MTLMRMVIPSTDREEFTYFVKDRIRRDSIIDFFNFDNRINNGVYTIFEWLNETITYDFMKETWTEYDQNNRIVYPLEDGSLIACAALEGQFIQVYMGGTTVSSDIAQSEADFMLNVSTILKSDLVFEAPFVVEFNPGNYYMNRNTPTVVLLGKEVWYNQGHPPTIDTPQIVLFKNMANIAFMPKSIVSPERLYFVQEAIADHIILPAFIIRKNVIGFGNTVYVNATEFSTTELTGMKSIFTFLQEDFIWKNILIPMATEEFYSLKEALEGQEIPLVLQAKAFNIKSYAALLQDIVALNLQKEEQNCIISENTKVITDSKLEIDRIEKQVAAKETQIAQGFASKKIETDLQRVIKLPYVTDLTFTAGGMIIHTEPIQIDDGPMLGGYKIVYNPSNRVLKIFNEVNPDTINENLAHPHIPQGGNPCFGNYADIFFRFQIGEICVGMELLHKFLSTYNPEDSWGRRMRYWDKDFFYHDMKERELLYLLGDSQDRDYHEIMGEHLPHISLCDSCGEPARNCQCNNCPTCGRHEDDCECWICPHCGENVNEGNCGCDRCENCNELIGDCECDRCERCGELEDPNGYYSNNCECERCPEDYDIYVDADDENGTCAECLNYDCEHNPHEEPQEERLFEE